MFRWLALVSVVSVFAISLPLPSPGAAEQARRSPGAVKGRFSCYFAQCSRCHCLLRCRLSDQSRLDVMVGILRARLGHGGSV